MATDEGGGDYDTDDAPDSDAPDSGSGEGGDSEESSVVDDIFNLSPIEREDNLQNLALKAKLQLISSPTANPSINPLLNQTNSNPFSSVASFAINAGSGLSLPATAPRHHVIVSYGTPTNGKSYVYINKGPTAVGATTTFAGFDEVVSITDTTNDSLSSCASPVTQTTQTHDQVGLEYNCPAVLPQYGVDREITVTWASGFTKVFTMLLPGTDQQGTNYAGGITGHTAESVAKTHGPTSTGDYDWTAGVKVDAPNYTNAGMTPHLLYTQTFVVSDPASVYWNGDSIIEHNDQNFASNVIYDLTSPFNYNNSSLTYGAHMSMMHGSGTPISAAFSNRAVPDKMTMLEQEFESITILIEQGQGAGAANTGLWGIGFSAGFFGTWLTSTFGWPTPLGGGSLVTPWHTLKTTLKYQNGPNIIPAPFVHRIVYSEYLYSPPVNRTVIDVCDNSNSPNYYLTTCKDCNGVTIPGCPGAISTTVTLSANPACCTTPCTNVLGFQNIFLDCSGYSATNGTMSIEVDPNFAGNTWGSGSAYTWTLTTTGSTGASISMSAPPTGGNTFTHTCVTNTTSGTEHQLTCSGNAQISTGLKITGTGIPANSYVGNIVTPTQPSSTYSVTKFEIVDANDVVVQATTAASNTMTFSASEKITWRALQPNTGPGGIGGFYTVKVVDEDGCDAEYNFTICQNAPTTGCTSTSAINYDSSANVGCTNCCVWCNLNGDGQLTDQSAGYSGDMWNVTSLTNTQIATNDTTSNGQLSASAGLVNSIVPYLDLDGTQSFTMTLYKTPNFGDPISSGTIIATQAGLGTNASSASHIFTGLAYGYYAVKVQLVDSDSTGGLEDCYTVFYGKVQVYICDDPNSSNYNTTVPVDLGVADPSLCTVNIGCCTIHSMNILKGCTTRVTAIVECDTLAHNVAGYWEKDGVLIQGSAFSINNVGSAGIGLAPITVSGVGIYTVYITATYNLAGGNQHVCNDQLQQVISAQDILICDCTDPIAINYNPSATADCAGLSGGTNYTCCTYCVYGCMDPNASNYDQHATCPCSPDCCDYPVYGCTDPNAVNYDPQATIDDGSCEYSACLDQHAANYLENCQGVVVPNATINAANCCFYPCTDPITGQPSNPATLTATTVDSTGTCTTPISDGTATITVTINSGAPTWTIYYTDGAGITLYTDTTVYAGNGSAAIWTGLAPGVYKAIVTDSYGCIDELLFAVSSSPVDVGCTDPNATNYDPNADCDDGSCIFCGCMDPLALNYNPAATCDDGTCLYPALRVGDCVPASIEDTLERIEACLLKKGSEFLKDIKIGVNEDCFTLDKWKLTFVNYLLGRYRNGLDCLFNCADEETPDPPTPCPDDWVTGGPATGVNDQGYAGSSITTGEGTTITDPNLFFVAATTLYYGDMIKMPSGIIWKMVEIGPFGCTNGCYNPETTLGANSGHWVICNSAYDLNITTTTNYIDNFINFVNIFCKDCDVGPDLVVTGGKKVTPPVGAKTLNYTQDNITFNF